MFFVSDCGGFGDGGGDIVYNSVLCQRLSKIFFTKQDRASGQGVLYGNDGLVKRQWQLWTRQGRNLRTKERQGMD